MDAGWSLKLELVRLPDELEGGNDRNGGVKDDTQLFGQNVFVIKLNGVDLQKIRLKDEYH